LLENLPLIPQRIAAGDRAAESDLIDYYLRRVYALILARLRDPELARDLTQDVLMGVLTAVRAGRLREHSALDGFVLGAARNHISNYFRQRSRQPVMEEVSPELRAPAIDDRLEIRERGEILRKALRRLTGEEREILRLTTVEQLSPAEIALRLGLASEAVRQRKSRALRRLGEFVAKFQSRRPGRIY
jgi:RNA polymerase sigma-70 factor (ECF subfamily)